MDLPSIFYLCRSCCWLLSRPILSRLVRAVATPLTAAAQAIGCAPTATLTAAAPGNPQRKTYISSSVAGSTSSSIAAVSFCGKSEQDQEGQLSTESSLYSIARYPPAPPPSPCKPPLVFSLASSLSNYLYMQSLAASDWNLLHQVDTNKYLHNCRKARDVQPTSSLLYIAPKWGGYNWWRRQWNNLGDNVQA